MRQKFKLLCVTPKAKELPIEGDYKLKMIGDFNEINGTAAIIGAGLGGADHKIAAEGIRNVTIPGRMQTELTKNHGLVVVDYAHNEASLKALMHFMTMEFNNPNIIVVVGAPGDKGVSRRPGISRSLNEYAHRVYFTTDDPGFEDSKDIADELDAAIDHDKVKTSIVLDRKEAIKEAISHAKKDDIVLLCGKGADAFQKIRGINTPYPSDVVVARDVIKELEK